MLAPSTLETPTTLEVDQKRITHLRKVLSDAKAENIQVYDLVSHKKNSYTDFIMIATAASTLHLRALEVHTQRALKEFDLRPLGGHKRQGSEERWIVIDCGNIVIHLFLKEDRVYYSLDEKIEKELSTEDELSSASLEERSSASLEERSSAASLEEAEAKETTIE